MEFCWLLRELDKSFIQSEVFLIVAVIVEFDRSLRGGLRIVMLIVASTVCSNGREGNNFR